MNHNRVYGEKELRGSGASPGIIIGKAHLVDKSRVKIIYQYLIHDDHVSKENERFKAAIDATEKQLAKLKDKMPEHVKEHAFILETQLMILKDNMLQSSVTEKIYNEKINAEWAIKKSLQDIREIFNQIEDEYISNRINDVEYVAERILRNLSGQAPEGLAEVRERVIIVADDLSPADTAELNISKIMGFITNAGGRTSHTSIFAQSLEIPSVVGMEVATREIKDGDLLIVDGNTGDVIVNPDDNAIIYYQEKQLQDEKYQSSIARTSHLPAKTLDGHVMEVMANIEFSEEVAAVKDHGGEGIGLYRTEYLYLKATELPIEDELFEEYREVAELIEPQPVIIRTLDLGGDKLISDLKVSNEMNPALGLRAIRFCLKEPKIFKTQLRAILKASAYGNVRIMFPMISCLQEILDSKKLLKLAKEELDKEKIPYNKEIEIGVMIEIPSAVTMADVLAKHVDFFSIGTNDLIQYALAIDRINGQVSYLYQPFHPAILRMILKVIEAARDAGIGVSLCGEMAGDPLCVCLLLALGLNRLSMTPRVIPMTKTIIRSISLEDARSDLENVLQLDTARAVREHLMERMKVLVPELDEKGYLRA